MIKGEGLLGAETTGKQYFEVVTTGLRACVGMQNSNNVLVHHDRDMGGAGVRDGQRQGMDRSIDIIVLGTRYWVGCFTYTNLFFNVHYLERSVSIYFTDEETKVS